MDRPRRRQLTKKAMEAAAMARPKNRSRASKANPTTRNTEAKGKVAKHSSNPSRRRGKPEREPEPKGNIKRMDYELMLAELLTRDMKKYRTGNKSHFGREWMFSYMSSSVCSSITDAPRKEASKIENLICVIINSPST